MGDRAENLRTALRSINDQLGSVEVVSGVYETEAWGIMDQPDFYNLAAIISTTLTPQGLMERILAIENSLGRIRKGKWEARLIDIDILYFGNRIVDLANLQIPHPHLQDRNFVLIPLLEIAPDFLHPVLKQTTEELYWQSTDQLEVIQLDQKVFDPERTPI